MKYDIELYTDDGAVYFSVNEYKQFAKIFSSFASHVGIYVVVVNGQKSIGFPSESDIKALF